MSLPYITPHKIIKGQGKHLILFLHGWGGNTKSFEKLSDTLLEKNKDIACVLLDFPGFGKSDMPPIEGWTTGDYADWLYKIINELKAQNQDPKAQCFLYGHSFGCRVIVRLLNKHPNIAHKIILTGAAGIKWPPTIKQKVLHALASVLKPLKGILPLQGGAKGGPFGKIQRQLLRFFGAHDWEECSQELKPTLQKVLAEPDFRDTLKNIQCPTLLLWGGQDTYTPLKSAKIYQEHIEGSKLVVYPDGRHGIHYTHADQITDEVLKFLD